MIKLVVFDFDGVFTNGKVYFNNDGVSTKHYNVKDGMGIKLLKKNNIKIAVISGYKKTNSQLQILKHLNINLISFSCDNKLSVLKEWCAQFDIDINTEVAYMGDDINDIKIIDTVSISGCPKDAMHQLFQKCNFISSKNGGNGCIREFIDYILDNNNPKKYTGTTYLNEICIEVKYQLNHFNLKELEQLADIVNKYKKENIYFMGIGKSGNIAKHCADLLRSLSFNTFFLCTLNALHGDIGNITNKDLVILFSKSGNTKELLEIIPYLKLRNVYLYGICCNKHSKFKELCDKTIETPFKQELSGNINKIPTNSIMSHLIFCNILVSILKNTTNIYQYKENHPAGIIGKDLRTIKDVIIKQFPKVYIEKNFSFSDILLEMTQYKIGCCFFVNKKEELVGILTDGDIRRILINNDTNINVLEKINKNYYYETNIEKRIIDCRKCNYIPIITNKKIIGIISFI